MPSQFIKLDPTKVHAKGALDAVNLYLIGVNAMKRSKAILEQIASGTDWVSVAAEFGITPAEAQTYYNIVAAAYVRYAHADTDALSRLDQNG